MSEARVTIDIGNIGQEEWVTVVVDRSVLAENLRIAREHYRKLGSRPGEKVERTKPFRIKGVKEVNKHGVINILSHDAAATIYTAAQLDINACLAKSDGILP